MGFPAGNRSWQECGCGTMLPPPSFESPGMRFLDDAARGEEAEEEERLFRVAGNHASRQYAVGKEGKGGRDRQQES